MRSYAPNREPDVVLKCGCITSNWGALQVLGVSGEFQRCTAHPDGEGKWGFQKILRKASQYELYRWRYLGKPAPKRRSSRAPEWVQTMSGKPEEKTDSKPGRQQQYLF